MSQSITLSPGQFEALRAAARAAHPRECCGLLVGEGEDQCRLTDIVATTNVADDPSDAFAVDPQAQFDLLRSLRGSAQRVIGHYHSHPRGPAQLSPRDLAMAHDPDALWVLVADETVRAFRRPSAAPAFVEIPVVVSP